MVSVERPCSLFYPWIPFAHVNRTAHIQRSHILSLGSRCLDELQDVAPVLVLEVVPELSRTQEAGNVGLGIVLSLGHIEAEADDIEDDERP